MNIQSEIRDYIHTHDFVMLPGIGAFLAEYSKPFIDEYGNLVPATRSIRFNSLLRNDSNVEILEVFKDRLSVSTEQVQSIYFDFLETIENAIDKTGSYRWEGLGMLIKGNDGELNFLEQRPERSQIFNSLEVIQEPEQKETQSVFEEPVVKDNKTEGGTLGRILVFALPLLLLTLALIYTVFIKPGMNNNLSEEASVENSDFNLEDSAEFEVDTLFSEPAASISNEKSIKQETLGIEKEHIIKVGLYKTQGDADLIATLLAERGYPARVRPYGKLFKVYIVARDEEQVKRFIAEVTAIDEFGVTPVYEK